MQNNLEQRAQTVIHKLIDKHHYIYARNLILSRDRWLNGHKEGNKRDEKIGTITDEEFENTINGYKDMIYRLPYNWTEEEKETARILDHNEDESRDQGQQELRKNLLSMAWKYDDGLIEEEELKERNDITRRRLVRQKLQPLYLNY